MRLSVVEHGHRPLQKLQLAIIGLLVGHVPGPILVMSYRRAIFGKHYAAALQRAMRAPGAWSIADRELFAAFVSKKNACAY